MASIACQTLRPAEVILVDDNSADRTEFLLKEIQQSYAEGWIKIVRQFSNKGPGSARNAGWELASQPYIAFLDSDDAWHPQKIEIQWRWMVDHPEVVLTGHAYQVVNGALLDANIQDNVFGFNNVSKRKLLLANQFATPTVMLKRSLPYRFVEGKRACEDFLLWCEILLGGNKCSRSPLALTWLFKAAYGKSGLSGNLWSMEKGELDAYRRLARADLISFPLMMVLSVWSLLKFARRIIVYSVRV
ncbi:glycosyltransferase family 2 protein [Pseudomonas stutzeri]|nr:glycosyltransferase family 2 protein [Stutzerimonas stutzeri]